jgi:hypothetical protein
MGKIFKTKSKPVATTKTAADTRIKDWAKGSGTTGRRGDPPRR